MPRNPEKAISPREAVEAIYIDFEGFKDQAPSLIGILCEYDFEQIVLDPDLEEAARAKGIDVRPLSKVIHELVKRCQDEDRRVVAYSQAEKNEVLRQTGIELEPHYRDARMIGKRWANKLHPKANLDATLKSLAEFVGWSLPPHLGTGNVTSRLRAVHQGLEARGSFEELTAVQKGKWTKLLGYNRYDCTSMRDLTVRAAAELRGFRIAETARRTVT
jgi:hypothetical protein